MAHFLGIIGYHSNSITCLRTMTTNTASNIFVRFTTMREKQILARAIGIQKQNWEPRIFAFDVGRTHS